MAHVTTHRASGASFIQRLAGLRGDLRDRMQRARVYRTTFSELSGLSDRELSDLGIARSNIRGIAYEAAYRT